MSDGNSRVAYFFDELAPRWDSFEKSTVADLRYFLSPLQIKKGDKVLDIACGTGIITSLLNEKSESPVIGIDISSKMIEVAKAKYTANPQLFFETKDFYDFEETGFDWAVCFNAYPHFMDKKAFIDKLNSILAPNGCFAICHNISRHKLEVHHQGDDISPISRHLLPILEEIKDFKESFEIIYAKEDETSYWIIGKKKS